MSRRYVGALVVVLVWAIQSPVHASALGPCQGGWRIVPSPAPDNTSAFNDVWADAPNDVWAVGYSVDIYFNAHSLVERWNGRRWLIVPSPDASSVLAVSGTSAHDVWTVGIPPLGGVTQVEHWDGASWTETPTPNPDPEGGFYAFDDIAAVSPTDVWLAGSSGDFDFHTAIEHWGSEGTWTVVDSPDPDVHDYLFAVSATSATDAWAIGLSDTNPQHALTEHWDGTAWVPLPSPPVVVPIGLTSFGPQDAWTVARPSDYPALEHWNGSTWTQFGDPSTPESSVTDVAGTSSDALWVVGSSFNGPTRGALIERWNGTVLKRVPAPLADTYAALNSVSVDRTGLAWSVGETGPDGTVLIERTCSA